MTQERGRAFGRVAEEYDRVRSGYPAELVDEACALGGLSAGSRVVEVGSGTGKLTVPLVERGLEIEAVELDEAMAAVARRQVGDTVRFHLVPFEEVELPEHAFDAVFSATAWHWIDPSVGWAKAARLLRPGGLLALLSHVGSTTELSKAHLAAWQEVLPEATEWEMRDAETLWAGAEERRSDVSELWSWLTMRDLTSPDAAGLFYDVRIAKVPIDEDEIAERSIARTRTSSAYIALDAESRERFEQLLRAAFDRLGGSTRSLHFAVLVTARAGASK